MCPLPPTNHQRDPANSPQSAWSPACARVRLLLPAVHIHIKSRSRCQQFLYFNLPSARYTRGRRARAA
ncbi:unnamed protein product [Zymoseptoria tritici ST99CH_3D7]|uniref:Uncharacterized protein n=1 Tax=Zymoseptoria tritici (strain ST99CH_3D7) TaxID=1276538 RepID=A0A1X7SA61_ZYMT9|nr:unnamed protein product [Zymoseptoria tritici ST99CH_3D7]